MVEEIKENHAACRKEETVVWAWAREHVRKLLPDPHSHHLRASDVPPVGSPVLARPLYSPGSPTDLKIIIRPVQVFIEGFQILVS